MRRDLSPENYTVNESLYISGFGRTKLYELIRDGHLDARKLGKRTLISAASLRAFLASLPPARQA